MQDFIVLLRTVCDLKLGNCLFLEFFIEYFQTVGNKPRKAKLRIRGPTAPGGDAAPEEGQGRAWSEGISERLRGEKRWEGTSWR